MPGDMTGHRRRGCRPRAASSASVKTMLVLRQNGLSRKRVSHLRGGLGLGVRGFRVYGFRV